MMTSEFVVVDLILEKITSGVVSDIAGMVRKTGSAPPRRSISRAIGLKEGLLHASRLMTKRTRFSTDFSLSADRFRCVCARSYFSNACQGSRLGQRDFRYDRKLRARFQLSSTRCWSARA